VATAIEMSVMLILIIGALVSLIFVRRTGGFKWVQMLILLCIITDIGEIFCDFFTCMAASQTYVEANTQFLAIGTSAAGVLFYFNNSLVYWLYSFTQWTISIEVPRKLGQASEH
jgi:hypothetical protein